MILFERKEQDCNTKINLYRYQVVADILHISGLSLHNSEESILKPYFCNLN